VTIALGWLVGMPWTSRAAVAFRLSSVFGHKGEEFGGRRPTTAQKRAYGLGPGYGNVLILRLGSELLRRISVAKTRFRAGHSGMKVLDHWKSFFSPSTPLPRRGSSDFSWKPEINESERIARCRPLANQGEGCNTATSRESESSSVLIEAGVSRSKDIASDGRICRWSTRICRMPPTYSTAAADSRHVGMRHTACSSSSSSRCPSRC